MFLLGGMTYTWSGSSAIPSRHLNDGHVGRPREESGKRAFMLGSRCRISTKAIPDLDGSAFNSAVKAARPPAEAPIATTGKGRWRHKWGFRSGRSLRTDTADSRARFAGSSRRRCLRHSGENLQMFAYYQDDMAILMPLSISVILANRNRNWFASSLFPVGYRSGNRAARHDPLQLGTILLSLSIYCGITEEPHSEVLMRSAPATTLPGG